MSNIIIIEGCDKTGKTTLSKLIVEKLGYNYIKCSQPVKPAFEEYNDLLNNLDKSKNYVIDRFIYGEFVYGPLYRLKCGISSSQFIKLEDILLSLFNTTLIYCHDDVENIKNRFISEKEDFSKIQDIDSILYLYERILFHSRVKRLNHKINSNSDLTYIFK